MCNNKPSGATKQPVDMTCIYTVYRLKNYDTNAKRKFCNMNPLFVMI